MCEEDSNLLEDFSSLPSGVRHIFERYDVLMADGADPYHVCQDMVAELTPMGYALDYDLSGEPCHLKRIEQDDSAKNQ